MNTPPLLFVISLWTFANTPSNGIPAFQPSPRDSFGRNSTNQKQEGGGFFPGEGGEGYPFPGEGFAPQQGNGPYPTYGPPSPTEGPPTLFQPHIDLVLEDLILRCVIDEPYEHIVWSRFGCPNEYIYGRGEIVAEGAVVYEPNHYDIELQGHDGVIVSSFLIKNPLHTGGIYACHAWPHYPTRGESYQYNPPHYSPVSDVFLVGGREVIDKCFHSAVPIYANPQRPQPPFKVDKTKRQQIPPSQKLKVPNLTRKSRNATSAVQQTRQRVQVIKALQNAGNTSNLSKKNLTIVVKA